MTVQSPFIIRKRIVEKGKLEGVLVENQNKLYKLDSYNLFELIEFQKRAVIVDSLDADKPPASLAIVHKNVADGFRFYFRSVRDNVKTNDFSKVPQVRLVSSRKYPKLSVKQ